MLEDFIIKYYWGAAGMCITALPIFFGEKASLTTTAGARTESPFFFFFFFFKY